MALASAGLGSGLDVNNLVSQLMALESRPLTALATKEAKYQTQLTAYGSLKGALSAFQSALAALTTPARFSAVNASVADTAVATAAASSSAAAGSYSLEVQTLAQAQKLKSSAFASNTASIGTGTLTIQFGTYAGGAFTANANKTVQAITIDAGKSSLAGVRDAINAANAGVTASVINDGTGSRLVIASKDSGAANALKITVADDDLTHTDNAGLSQLAYDASTGGTMQLTQAVAAQNATFLLDGIAVSKASNTINDVIDGVTLNLLKASTPAATTLSVSRDTAGAQSAVQSFVKAYNDLHKTIGDLSKYDPTAKKSSTLTGEATLRSVQSQLRGVFNTALPAAGGGLSMLADIGLTFQKDGSLKLDTSRLNTVLGDPTKDVASLFTLTAKPTDSLVSYAGSTNDTNDGTFLLNISQIATQGRAVGGSAAALTISAGINDTLTVSVNGTPATLTLGAGIYTPASLAAELQSRINGAATLSTAGASVLVTQSSGILTVTSSRYGSASSIAITGGNAMTDLFGTVAATAGVDVAGTVNGVAATGTGQTLTGTGDASGLTLTIAGGATGFRGAISHTRGYAHVLDKLVGRMLENDSLLDGRIDGINASIKSINAQREALTQRLAMAERRYRAQFSALDSMIASMSKTSSFLQQQLANLPKAG